MAPLSVSDARASSATSSAKAGNVAATGTGTDQRASSGCKSVFTPFNVGPVTVSDKLTDWTGAATSGECVTPQLVPRPAVIGLAQPVTALIAARISESSRRSPGVSSTWLHRTMPALSIRK